MNYIGIDIGGTNLKAGLTDENGRLLAVKSMKIREVSDPDVLADTLVTLTEELAAQGGIAVQDIASVGAGIPGVVDIRTGSIVYTCNLPLRNIPLRKLFKRRLGLHLYVENDANCAALAEYYAGAGQGSKRFVTITLGTGIGARNHPQRQDFPRRQRYGRRGGAYLHRLSGSPLPLRPAGLLGAVRLRQRSEAVHRPGIAGQSRQHPGPGHP